MELGPGIDEAEAIGTDETHATGARGRDDALLQEAALRTRLRKPRRDADSVFDTLAGRRLDGLQDGGLRHTENGNVGRLGQLVDGAEALMAQHRRPVLVDEVDAPPRRGREQPAAVLVAPLAWIFGGADDGDRSR